MGGSDEHHQANHRPALHRDRLAVWPWRQSVGEPNEKGRLVVSQSSQPATEIEQTEEPFVVTLKFRPNAHHDSWINRRQPPPPIEPIVFVCIACQRDVREPYYPPRYDWQKALPPFCRSCEHTWSRGVGRPTRGSITDKRRVVQIKMMADLISAEVNQIKWRARHGRG